MTMEKNFDAATAESRIAAMWEDQGCFKAGANARDGADSYCVMLPPPNVTGSLHMGHALNHTLQDILVRWKRMQGFDTLWQPGQDHAGIATQMVVERRLAAEERPSRRELGREAFLKECWKQKEASEGTIIGQDKRLGVSVDWSRNRFTMDEGLSEAVLKVFVQLYEEGLIYKDKRLVNWDPHFETAISDLEVEQVEVQPGPLQGKLWRFRYPLEDGRTYRFPIEHDEDGVPTAWEERDYIVVATTRPETMLGDTGVAVHPEDERYKELIGHHVILPIVGRRIPIVADQHADPETGSGAVKITPAHDFNDFQVGKRCELPMINIMTPRAAITIFDTPEFWENTPYQSGPPETDAKSLKEFCAANQDLFDLYALEGLDRKEARKQVLAMIEARGCYDGADDHANTVPHGDRSKQVVEPYLTDQWFVDAKTLAQPAIEAVRKGETKFAPQSWDKTYFQWLENIEPWCISRQLWWGHQVPVWYGPDGTPFCAHDEKAAQKAAKKHYNTRKKVELNRDEDVLDTWFSSALWPFSTLGWPEKTPELEKYYKTDVLVTGFDIIFFWVARMMMAGMHFMKDEKGAPEVPFHTVYVHALVRDEHGNKMSKSLGNVIDPLNLIDDFGADAVRFTLTSMAAMGRDIKLAVSRVEGYRNFGTKLWNAARFAEMNGCVSDANFDPAQVKQPINRWIVGETARLRQSAQAALEGYRFNDYANGLYAHVWNVYCDWYLEFAKPLLTGEDAAAKSETQKTAAWALDQILALMHPVSPFITEELWAATGERSQPLATSDWPELAPAQLADQQADAEINWVIKLIEEVRSVRAELNVSPGAKIQLRLQDASDEALSRMERNAPLIERLARLESWSVGGEAQKGEVSIPLDGATACLPLADVVDVKAEKARLKKATEKAEKAVKGIEAKLANEKFLAKAPEEVVEEQRERLADAQAQVRKLGAAMERLNRMG